jgi:hypothetical protein
MLSVGTKTLFRDGERLSLGEILSFLWECYQENADACFVGFFLSYDFTSWLKQLPERQAYLLLSHPGIKERTSQRIGRKNPFPDPVVWAGWELDIMAGRRFKLRPHTHRVSMFSDVCRNRTCGERMEYTPSIDGEPSVIVVGELEWTVDESAPALPFTGWHSVLPEDTSSTGGKDGWLYICDTGSFWQTSFLKVIDPKSWGDRPVCTDEEYATVLQGKADRGAVHPYGETGYFEEMRKYNVLENDILGRVTARLNEGFMNDRIPIRIKRNEWYGPGRAAQTWMDMLDRKIQDSEERGLTNASVYRDMPAWFVDAARNSYYGGWFEQFVHGHVGDVWEYDINSAYPFIIASLPCLHTEGSHTGRYERGTGDDYRHGRNPRTRGGSGERSRLVLVHATIRGSDPYIGVMPFRTQTGNILRPHNVRGWYWEHEMDAARRAGLIDTVEVHEWAAYTPCHCPPPFNPSDIGIERMYNLRLEVGKNSPAGKAFKLVYNSAYGKTAQSIGTPKYSNPVYASLITAGCRTLILEAIASHPRRSAAVSMVATDGIYFLDRHPSLPLSATKLGGWDETFKAGMTQLMPGVYWDDETRKRVAEGAAPKLKSRGVPARDLANQITRLDALFAEAHFNLSNGFPYEWPVITFTQQFTMLTATAALARGKWNQAGKVDHGTSRSISANPRTKRIPEPYRDNDWGGIVRTRPYGEWTTLDTWGYKKAFGYDNSGMDPEIGDDGRDGLAYFRDLLNR